MCGSGQSKIKAKNTKKDNAYVINSDSQTNRKGSPSITPVSLSPKLGKIEKEQSLNHLQMNASVPNLKNESPEK